MPGPPKPGAPGAPGAPDRACWFLRAAAAAAAAPAAPGPLPPGPPPPGPPPGPPDPQPPPPPSPGPKPGDGDGLPVEGAGALAPFCVHPHPRGDDVAILVHPRHDLAAATAPERTHLPLLDRVAGGVNVKAKLATLKAHKLVRHRFQLFQHLGAEALLQRGASIKLLVSALGAPPRHGGHASGAAATDAAAVADAPSASTRAILPRVGGSHTTGVWEAAGGSARPRATTVPIDGQPPDAAADRGVLPHRQRPGGARHTRVGRPTAPIRGCPIAAQPPPPSAFNQETHAFRQLSPRQQLA